MKTQAERIMDTQDLEEFARVVFSYSNGSNEYKWQFFKYNVIDVYSDGDRNDMYEFQDGSTLMNSSGNWRLIT